MTLFFRSFVTMDGGDGDNAFEEAVIWYDFASFSFIPESAARGA